ncbi:MAG TPA: DUF4097 family beta strand repeat-containing protein [Thermoanaerobaculia bacterium]|nr:DUF4097 family beta strand repeat-containing protein [Thermoanaerobaculia bacterium]
MRRRILLTIFSFCTLALGLARTAEGQVELDRRRPAQARGAVMIHNAFGSVTVRAWDKNEVQVRGTLAAGAEGFDLDGDKEGISLHVGVPDAWDHAPAEDAAFRSTLEISAPVGSRISVETVNATVQVEGFTGDVEVETVNGSVKVVGPAARVRVESMTGNVEVRATAAALEIRTISGAVVAQGAAKEVRVETASGKVDLSGNAVSALEIESTTGPVSYRGSLAKTGAVRIQTFSSPIALALPKTTRASFHLQTFGGKIQSAFCTGTPVTRERFEPFKRLHCATGPEELEIELETHDADITLTAE